MEAPNFVEIFCEFFESGEMRSSLKAVFLYALTDVRLHNKEDLVGSNDISINNDEIVIPLDFLAIRMARYYWEILDSHIQDANREQVKPAKDIKFKTIIEEYHQDHQLDDIPWLIDLMSDDMKVFRKEIINKGMKPELLRTLKTKEHNWYEVDRKNNTFVTHKSIIDYFDENTQVIKDKLSIKIEKQLDVNNPGGLPTKAGVSLDSPFYRSLRNQNVSVFIICVNENMKNAYDLTVKQKIDPKKYSLDYENKISVWGVSSTDENIKSWKKIQKDDFILFSTNNVCFSMSRAMGTLNTSNMEKKPNLWKNHTDLDLLIVLDKIRPFELNLSSNADLVSHMVPDVCTSQIMCVANERLVRLMAAYGSVGIALKIIGEQEITNDGKITLVWGKTKIRKGQLEFRNMVLQNYYNMCAVCGVSEKRLLEASHILPVGNRDTSGAKDNGICLCVLHHKMFDVGYLYFTDDYKVGLGDCVKDPVLQKSVVGGSCIRCDTKPNKNYLKSHRTRFGYGVGS